MEIKSVVLAEVDKARLIPHIPREIIHEFKLFINGDDNLLRTGNVQHHLCAYFLPVHTSSRSVFLVHHKKASAWIPPGGHVDPYETLIETVKREYFEELSWKLTTEPIKLTDLTVTHINTPRHPCRTHYDFWYRIDMEKTVPFIYDRNEFFDAKWFPLEEGLRKMEIPNTRQAVANTFRV